MKTHPPTRAGGAALLRLLLAFVVALCGLALPTSAPAQAPPRGYTLSPLFTVYSGNAVVAGTAVNVSPGQYYRIANLGNESVRICEGSWQPTGGEIATVGGAGSRDYQAGDGVSQIVLVASSSTSVTVTVLEAVPNAVSGTYAEKRYQKVLAALGQSTSTAPVPMASPPTLTSATTRTLTTHVNFNDARIRVGPARLLTTAGAAGTGRYQSYLGLNNSPGFFSCEILCDGPSIEFDARCGDGIKIWVDGQLAGGYVTQSNAVLTYYKVDFGSRAIRRIRFEMSGTSQFYGFETAATDAILPAPAAPLGKLWTGVDSFSLGTNGQLVASGDAAPNLLNGYAPHLARRLGLDLFQLGCGGTSLINPGSGAGTLASRWSTDVTAVDTSPGVFFLMEGYNSVLTQYASYTSASLRAALASTVSLIRTSFPNAVIVVAGPQAPTSTLAAATAYTNVRDDLKVACAAAGVYYIDMLTGAEYHASGALVYQGAQWLNGTGRLGATTGVGYTEVWIGRDSVHPTDIGHLGLALLAEQAIRRAVGASIVQKAMMPTREIYTMVPTTATERNWGNHNPVWDARSTEIVARNNWAFEA